MLHHRGIRGPVAAIVCLSAGGLLLHLRLHPVSFDPAGPENPAHFIPFVTAILGTVAVPVLLGSARTFVIGYLINGMSVVIGTITMTHMSLAAPPHPLSVSSILLGSSLAYILLLLPKLFIGHRVLLHYHPNGMGRFFTPWWWLRHFAYVAVAYTLGHYLWR